MNWEKFKEFFHESWHPVMQPFIESEDCDQIYSFLKFESRRGKKIAPSSHNVYRCFYETPREKVKVVLLGMCPYHTQFNGVPVADGLLMGCSITEKIQPSLDQFYNALEKDIFEGLNLRYDKIADVCYLANQGVLMWNAALTTEINKAGSHLEIWEKFTSYVFMNGITPLNVPVVFLGVEAGKFERYMPPLSWSFLLSHPASASYKHTKWNSDKTFSKINRMLHDEKKEPINWLQEDLPF